MAAAPIVGVSLGHRHEKTAISVVERSYLSTGEHFTSARYDHSTRRQTFEAREAVSLQYRVRHLERHGPPARYSKVARKVSEVVRRIGRSVIVVVDVTATGRPVYSLILKELTDALADTRIHIKPCPITVSGLAGGVSRSPDVGYLVPRRDLISAAQILFDDGGLKIAEELELARTLADELIAFTPKAQKPDDLEGWRERPHDDLVLAVATSVWAAERFLRKEKSRPAGEEFIRLTS